MFALNQILRWLEFGSISEPSAAAEELSYADRVGELYSRSQHSPFVNIILALLTVSVIYDSDPVLAMAWLSLLAAVNLIRFIHLRFASSSELSSHPAQHCRSFAVGLTAAAICWGLLPVLFFPMVTVHHQIFIAFVLAGVTAGGITVLSSARGTAIVFLPPILVPLATCFFFENTSLHYTMGVMVVLYLFFLTKGAFESRNTIASSTKTTRENQILLREVQSQAEHITTINQELGVALTQAQESNETKSRFLANMSHEIRTPINGVLGMLELAIDDCQDSALTEHLRTGRESAESLLSIVNDILDFSKIEDGKLLIELRPFPLREAVEQVVKTIEGSCKGREVVFVVHIEDAVPERIVSDEVRFKQILMNLVGNAAKFTGESGAVIILVEYTAESSQKGQLEISVSDTGTGIAESKTTAIFQAFTQGDPAISRTHGGTGLGLSITAELVKLLNGTVTLESIEQRGSRFTVSLPVTVAQLDHPVGTESELVESLLEQFSGREVNILVVDDNLVNQKFIKAILEKRGFTVTVAANGAEAVLLCVSEHFDAVLMDCQMPVMDGYVATEKIRENERKYSHSSPTPIIAVTAHAMADEKVKCLEHGMNGYVTKPIRKEELFRTLAEVLESK